jgi:hypothetical protein
LKSDKDHSFRDLTESDSTSKLNDASKHDFDFRETLARFDLDEDDDGSDSGSESGDGDQNLVDEDQEIIDAIDDFDDNDGDGGDDDDDNDGEADEEDG